MAQMDFFLKIEGLLGESIKVHHEKEIEILSWSWGEAQTGGNVSSGGGGAGKVTMQPFHFTASVSAASPRLFLACANGQHFRQAVLTAFRPGRTISQPLLTWKLTDVMVSAYQTGANSTDGLLTETFDLAFSGISVEYSQLKPDGSLAELIKAGWDLRANKPV